MAEPDYILEAQTPFGVIIRNTGNTGTIAHFDPQQLLAWIEQYKILVFRGYASFPKQDFALYAQGLGEPMQWPFGAINELIVKIDAENYIFTNREVPMHWDGAFAGTIPHVILFQCLKAPNKADGGGTTFCNTTAAIESVDDATLKRWQNIEVTYTTQKLAHYGGQIKQRLVAPHPVTETPVIRYAEPVTDLNPVQLKVAGIEEGSQEQFTQEMHDLLYDQRFLYTHYWEKGDIVMADNFTLLHGREAFREANDRHIQRINVLPRPAGFRLSRFLKNSFTIRRKEFFVAELPIVLIPIVLGIQSLADLMDPSFGLAVLAIFLFFNIGDMINCYTDYRLDAIYKSHLSNAVYELGKKNVALQMVLTFLLAMGITVYLAIAQGAMYLIPLTLIGTVIGFQYSAKPFKFKSRGGWQFLCLWGIIFFGPMLYITVATGNTISILTLGLFASYGLHQMGIILLNTSEDYPEDVNDGIHTLAVALGLHRTIQLAWWIILFSGIALQLLLAGLMYTIGVHPLFYGSILIFTVGWITILVGFRKIIGKIAGLGTQKASDILKKNGMKVPQWLKVGAYTTLAIVALLLLERLLLEQLLS